MRFVKSILTIITIGSLLHVTACSDEDVIKNQIAVGDKTYLLANAYMFKVGEPVFNDNNEYLGQIFDTQLVSDDVQYYDYTNFVFSGDDEVIRIALLSSSENEPAEGIYVVRTEETEYIPNCVTAGVVYVNWNFGPGLNPGMVWVIEDGEVLVTKLKDKTYGLKFSFTLKNGPDAEQCRGSFSGAVVVVP